MTRTHRRPQPRRGKLRDRAALFFALSTVAGCGDAGATGGGASGGGLDGGSSEGGSGHGGSTSTVIGLGGSDGGSPPTYVCDPPAPPGSLYELSAESLSIDEVDPVSMCQYRGDVLLLVNIAAV